MKVDLVRHFFFAFTMASGEGKEEVEVMVLRGLVYGGSGVLWNGCSVTCS